MAGIFLVLCCYPGRDEKLCIVPYIFLINTNINFLPSDCNTDAQIEYVDTNGRHLSSIVHLPYPLAPKIDC